MPKFRVLVNVNFNIPIEVDADTKEQAQELAADSIVSDIISGMYNDFDRKDLTDENDHRKVQAILIGKESLGKFMTRERFVVENPMYIFDYPEGP